MTERRFAAGRVVVLTALLAVPGWSGAAEAAPPSSGTYANISADPIGGGGPDIDQSTTASQLGVDRLIEQLRLPETRRAARDALASIGSPAVEGLLRYLNEPDMTIRWEIATILGTIGDQRAVPGLVRCTVEDENPHVRWRSLWSLSRFKQERETTIAALRKYCNSDVEIHSWNAAVALSMFDEPDGVPLFHANVSHFKPWRRWEAINALGRVHDRATVQVLAGVLASDRARDRQEAVLTLGKIGGDEAVKLLVESLQDSAEDVRWRACLALGRTADPVAADPLTALIAAGDEARVLQHARDALARLEETGSSSGNVATVTRVDRSDS